MILKIEDGLLETIKSYRLPAFSEIPDVGLYLNQSATYINRALCPLFGISITESMISNYVKKKLIDNPVKKQYSREMIAYLMFITLAKSAASLDDIQLLISLQKKRCSAAEAYEGFKNGFESILGYVFGFDDGAGIIKDSESIEEELLKNIIITVAHKIYADMAFSALRAAEAQSL